MMKYYLHNLRKSFLNSRSFLSWLMAWVSVLTMVSMPLAQAQEAMYVSKQQMLSAMDQMGLNKQQTVGEFYKKNKELFPERIRKMVEPIVMNNLNQRMPQFELSMSKGTDGRDIPTLHVNNQDKQMNLQWFGEPNRFVQFQSTNLTEIDLINFEDVFLRLTNADENLRNQFSPSAAQVKSQTQKTVAQKTKSVAFPPLTKQTWAAMSEKDRVGYMINMRLLWRDSLRVLELAPKSAQPNSLKNTKGRKTSSYDVLDKWNAFLVLLENAAQADRWGDDKGSNVDDNKCIVAGYISKYNARGVCTVESIFRSYVKEEDSTKALPKNRLDLLDKVSESNPLVAQANRACSGKNQIACNPLIYGTPGGMPVCVNTAKTNVKFQTATHFDGLCERGNAKLSNEATPTEFLKDKNLKNKDRYLDDNRSLTDEQLKAQYEKEQEQNPELVGNYLNGILKFKKSNQIQITKDTVLDKDTFDEIMNIRKSFNKEIDNAKQACRDASARGAKKNERNFWGACDQLHRRFLNVAAFLEKTPGCKDNATFNKDSLMCSCPVPSAPATPKPAASGAKDVKLDIAPIPTASGSVEVYPGASCSGVAGGGATSPGAGGPGAGDSEGKPPEPPGKKKNCEADYPGVLSSEMKEDCTCNSTGKLPQESAKDSSGATSFTCSKDSDKKECGFLCSAGKFVKKYALTAVLTGLVAFGLYKIFKPKKIGIKSPGDACPNGTTAPCSQTCAYPFTNQNGVCGCAPCAAGQTLSSTTTCICTTSTTTTTTYTCPDGVTKVTDYASCPTSLTCPDGVTKVVNLINCPEVSTSSATKSGSSKVKNKK